MAHLIWMNPDTIILLRDFLVDFTNLQDMTPEVIIENLASYEPRADWRPTARALRNFMDGTTAKPRKLDGLDTLTTWLVDFVPKYGFQELRAHKHFPEVQKIAWTINTSRAVAQKTAISERDFDTAATLVASLLQIDESKLMGMIKTIFRASDERPEKQRSERYFICYRYHSLPGYIAKSFLVVLGRLPNTPGICRFSHFFKGTSGGQRRSDGLILPFQNGLYFIGQSSGGEGLKLIATRSLSSSKPIHEGLVVSFDDDAGIIASRILLADTSISQSGSAGIGVFRESDLNSEIANYKSRIRNKIDFTLTSDIFLDGKAIDQQAMVVAVGEALRDANGKSRLTHANGTSFNPAAERYYTFNSVLKMWSDNENTVS